jgi:transposase
MSRIYSEEEKQQLLEIAYSEKSSRRVKTRVMAVNMYANDVSILIIAKTLRISDKSVKKYIQKYEEKGLLELIQENPYRPKSVLEDYTKIITENLESEPCSTINECRERIKKLTGIERSPTQITNFIKKKDSGT